MKKINEVFYSIQGEGYFTGTPTVFILSLMWSEVSIR